MRAAIGEMELDQILHARAQLNQLIRSTVQEASVNWGIEIKRYEITEVLPDKHISEAMDKQAAAERERRKKVLHIILYIYSNLYLFNFFHFSAIVLLTNLCIHDRSWRLKVISEQPS
jgi:hypothetical protein